MREQSEYIGELGHIKGSRLVPLSTITSALEELEAVRNKEIVFVCRSGARSTTAAAILKGLGFEKVKNMKGGMLAWNKENLPISK